MGIEEFITKVAVQTAVYWGDPTDDGYGTNTFLDPVEIGVRWEDKTQMIVADNGEEIVSRAEILLTQDVDVGGMLFLGDLDDLDSASEADPNTQINAFEIKRFEKDPLIRSTTKFVRTCFL